MLDALSESGGRATLDELTKAVGEPRSSIHRVLSTLMISNVVSRGEARSGYRLSSRLAYWGSAFLKSVELYEEFLSIARPLARKLNETVQLAVLDLPDVVFVSNVDSTRLVRLATEVGRRRPAHATAAGKVLLAAEASLLEAIEELVALTPFTITSKADLAGELEKVRVQGFAITEQEVADNLSCLAVPVPRPGTVPAALSICVAQPRFEPHYLAVLAGELKSAAGELSRRLGASDGPEDGTASRASTAAAPTGAEQLRRGSQAKKSTKAPENSALVTADM